MIEFRCHGCGQKLRAHDGQAGKTARCGKCKRQILVPAQKSHSGVDEQELLEILMAPAEPPMATMPPAVAAEEVVFESPSEPPGRADGKILMAAPANSWRADSGQVHFASNSSAFPKKAAVVALVISVCSLGVAAISLLRPPVVREIETKIQAAAPPPAQANAALPDIIKCKAISAESIVLLDPKGQVLVLAPASIRLGNVENPNVVRMELSDSGKPYLAIQAAHFPHDPTPALEFWHAEGMEEPILRIGGAVRGGFFYDSNGGLRAGIYGGTPRVHPAPPARPIPDEIKMRQVQ